MVKKALDWIFVTDALRAARREFHEDEAVRGAALQQARLLSEIAGRIAEPAEPLPPGDRVPVILRVLQDGVALALTTTRPAAEAAPVAVAGVAPSETAAVLAPAVPDLGKTWDATPEAVLRDAAEDAADLATVKETLFGQSAPAAPEAPAVTRTRAFLDRLLWNADAPRRRVEALLLQRWLRVAAVLVALFLLGLIIRVVAHGKNLLDGKPFAVSSSWSGCSTDPSCDGVLLFHTNNENEPWVIFDLQTPTALHRLDVSNRLDSYQDRAVPLVAELSTDRQHWKEVGRRTDVFSTWTLTFPSTTARYIKLKVARVSTLHLKSVEAR